MQNYIASITFNSPVTSDDGLMARDQRIALLGLQHKSFFRPVNNDYPPYDLTLSIEESRLMVRMSDAGRVDLPMLVLSTKPYKRLIKDYFLIVQSYNEAIKGDNPSRIESIDMGRRGLHNEGAELLQERLQDKIDMDFDTARRLFTLICVLHGRKSLIWR